MVEEGKVEVTAEDNSLKVVLTGGAGANVFLGVESSAMQSFQVVQEFEITCSDAKIDKVVLTLESSLAGFIRSKHKASACVNLAGPTIAPANCAGPPLSVCYPKYCVSGATWPRWGTGMKPRKTRSRPPSRYPGQVCPSSRVRHRGHGLRPARRPRDRHLRPRE